MTVCRICQEAESKYKCPTCRAPYCSLTCYKPHKAEHEANPSPALPPPEPPAATPTIPEARPEDKDPFSPLLTTPLTPTLRKHLLSIHAATQKPTHSRNSNYRSRSGGRGRGRGGRGGGGRGGGYETREREWTEEHETKAAIEKLRKLREEGNEEIEEFVQMVVGLVEKEQGDALR
ncbi:unnamed protein product [Tuber aestivum]|uniref:HIT-type domain-containing protein n=1 Tax=Tuber aestivum TaxID=59557 RepID=A0A292Q0H4_9PEZI|nr:unnamed protein product [Tuber aestivum]